MALSTSTQKPRVDLFLLLMKHYHNVYSCKVLFGNTPIFLNLKPNYKCNGKSNTVY